MFLVALIVRVVVAIDAWNLPIVRTPKLDSAEYVSWARRLAAGDFAWPLVSQHGPGYPCFLAGLLAIGGGSLHAALVAQGVLGAVTAILIAATAREWLGSRTGLLAGLAYAVYGPAVYIDTAFLAEGLLLFLLSLALFALCRVPLTVARSALAGAALGAAVLVRPTALVMAAACVLWIVASVRRRQANALAMAAVLAGVCVITISPALVESWLSARTLAVQGYGGLNFYIGNSPLQTGRATFRLGAGWDALNSEASRRGISDPTAQDRYYITKTLAEIRAYPAAFLKLLAMKGLWLVQVEEPRDSHSYYFFTDRLWLLRVLPQMAILLPLAGVGLAALVRQRRQNEVLLYMGIAAAATTVLFVVGMRYRMPLVPVLAIAAGAGGSALAGDIEARRTRQLMVYALTVTVIVVVSHLQRDPQNRNLAEEWAFTGSSLITEHNLFEAEAAYRRALNLDPNSGLAWDGLGLVQYNSGRLAEARQAFSRALAIDRDSSRAAFHLALLDEREGRVAQAVVGYQRAIDLSPFDVEVVRHIGEALIKDNKPTEAIPHLRVAAGQMPNDSNVHRALATALGMAGRPAEAAAEMRRVVELAPVDGEAWLDLCLLLLDAHDANGAVVALQRARDLGAGPERLAFAAAALARVGK